MDNSAIGKIGTSQVTTYLSVGGYLDPHINNDDTIAMWDGNIFVYKTKDGFSNKDFDYKIPVQVKAEEIDTENFPKETTHPVPVIHLNKYYSDGGVVFFKVLICGSKTQIYVSFLTKEKIGNILSEIEDETQSTKTITLKQAPQDRDILLDNLNRINLHRQHTCIDFSQLKNRTDYKLHISTSVKEKNIDPFEYLATHYVDITVSVENLPGEFVLRDGPVRVMAIAKVPSKISVNNVVYYSEFTRKYAEDGVILQIGKSCSLKISYKTDPIVVSVNLTLKSSGLSEIINDAKFLLSIVEHKYIQFNDKKFPLKDLIEQDDAIQEWNKQLRFWKDVQTVFKTLRVPQTLVINKLSEEDYRNLNTIVNAFVYNKPVYGNIVGDTLHLLKIQNLRIAFLAKEIINGEFQMCNVYDFVFAFTDEAGVKHIFPTQSILLGFEYLPSNIKINDLLKEYKRLARNDTSVLIRANIDLLQLLNHYDRGKSIETINLAYKIAQWLRSDKSGKINERVSLLNYLQTVKRKNKILKRSEIKLLEDFTPLNDIEHFGKNAILGNVDEAKKYYAKLDESTRKLYKEMPISHLIDDPDDTSVLG